MQKLLFVTVCLLAAMDLASAKNFITGLENSVRRQMIDAGLGELGRHGLLITAEIHFGFHIMGADPFGILVNEIGNLDADQNSG